MVATRQLQDISRATIQAAHEEKNTELVVAGLMEAEKVFCLNPELLAGLSEKNIPLEIRQGALRDAWQLSIHVCALNALLILQEKELLNEIKSFIQIIVVDARKIAQHYEVNVRSVVPLQEDNRVQLKAALQKKLGGTQRIHEQLDASIVGGLLIEIGHWQLDVSIKEKIESLNHCLIA